MRQISLAALPLDRLLVIELKELGNTSLDQVRAHFDFTFLVEFAVGREPDPLAVVSLIITHQVLSR